MIFDKYIHNNMQPKPTTNNKYTSATAAAVTF